MAQNEVTHLYLRWRTKSINVAPVKPSKSACWCRLPTRADRNYARIDPYYFP